MKECRVLSATGMLGSGFPSASMKRALEMNPHFIGCDSGSSDFGPYALGSGRSPMPRDACKRDLRLMLRASRSAGIPVLVGSAGGAGGNPHLDWLREIVLEVAREDRLHFRLATIKAEQDPDQVARLLEGGRIRPLDPAPEVTAESVRRSTRIVAAMGAEPFQAALDRGADVVLAGRSTDAAIFSAIPLRHGFDPGLVWHAAKLLECGAAAVEHRLRPDCLMAFIREDHVEIRPPNPELRCTPLSVAAHTLYENGDPFHLYEPSGMLDTTHSTYEQAADGRSVRIAGTHFVQADEYTVKLEGAEFVGYQSMFFAGIRDSAILANLDVFLDSVRGRVAARIHEIYADTIKPERDYQFRVVVYGRDGVMGALEPKPRVDGHEVAVMLETTAATQELADTLLGLSEYIALHNPVEHWKGFTTNLAFSYCPTRISRGAAYRFSLNHLLALDDPLEVFDIRLADV